MHSLLRLKTFLIVAALSIGTTLSATDVWDNPAFSTDPAILREHWSGSGDVLDTIQRVLNSADTLVGSKIAGRLKKILKRT